MNRKMLLWAAAVLCLIAIGIARAADNDAFIGTWKLNEAKSKMMPGTAKNSTVVYSVDGDNIKCTIEGTDAKGQPYKSEWVGKFDGKDYPVTGDPSADSRAYTKVSAHTIEAVAKKDGKVTTRARISLSADGKTRTVNVSAKDANGKMVKNTAVYDKES